MSSEISKPASAPASSSRRLRMLLLSLLGSVALLLPLSQVLRFQFDELADIAAERSRLDPLSATVALQRGLLGHDEVAAHVLAGRRALEAERRVRAAEVERSLAQLQGTLLAGDWKRARHEALGLQRDWAALLPEIEKRRIAAAASAERHRLLIEQSLQVLDLLEARLLPPGALPQQLAWLEQRLDARHAALAQRQARAQSALAWSGLGLGALLLMLLLFTHRMRAPASSATPSPGRRQGHGRRASDRAPQPTPSQIADEQMAALRTAWDTESPPLR
jgi:hypothetical protein